MKKTIMIMAAAIILCFAQDAPEKLAVYVSGTSNSGINKSLGNKLLVALVQSGNYTEIADPESFQDEIAKGGKGGKSDITQISQVAKKHGAEYVCVVNVIEALGAHSISARLIKISGLNVVKNASTDRSLKSLEDITAVSNELSKQLIPQGSPSHSSQPAAAAHQYYAPQQQLPPPVAAAQQYFGAPQQPQQPTQQQLTQQLPPPVAAAQQYFGVQQPTAAAVAPAAVAPVAAAAAAAQYFGVPQPPTQQPNPAAAAAAAQQYFGASPPTQPATIAAAIAPSLAAAPKQCEKTFNINEVISKLKGFPNQLKDCSSKLAKDMALAAAPMPGFLKKSSGPTEKIEPKSYMMRCSVDGIRKELPDGFPDADKLIGNVNNFVQKIMNLASGVNGDIDPSKLMSAVNNMNIDGLLSEVKGMLASADCMVDEVYTPAAETFNYHSAESKSSSPETKNEESMISFGFRAGVNVSYIDAEYDAIGTIPPSEGSYGKKVGMQIGMVVDIAVNEMFHIQPGIMYARKGTSDYIDYPISSYYPPRYDIVANYIEIPVLLSLKLSMFRLNVGPYFAACLSTDYESVFSKDLGLSAGLGFDIGMFYIGASYDYGFTDMSSLLYSHFYNRSIGLNVGVNL